MIHVFDLLREADPVEADSRSLDEARPRIRRTVIAASMTPTSTTRRVSRRRLALHVSALLVGTLTVGALILSTGGRGILQAAIRFEVRLAETEAVPGLIVARLNDSNRVIYLHPEAIVTNDDIAQRWVTQDGADRFGISVELTAAGAERMRQATANHIGRPVAIMIDGEVVMAPVVRSAIGSSAVISGGFSRSEAERIADGIGAP